MRILQLTNYPIVNPLHGGQIRSSQICKALREAGHDVLSMGIFPAGDHAELGDHDIAFERVKKFWEGKAPWLADYYTGIYAVQEKSIASLFVGTCNEFRPEIIVVEQPWLFNLAKNYAKVGKVKVIYSSQNVEWKLKEKLFDRNIDIGRSNLVDEMRANEIKAVLQSDLVVACTKKDVDYYRALPGVDSDKNFILAGNGVEPFSCSPERVEQWRLFLSGPTAVFVSSAHYPNAQGFWDMVSPGLTFLNSSEKILVLGGVSGIIMNIPDFAKYADVNLSRLNLAGIREKKELQALIKASHVVILPISDGEGSNLKTAEALESGCYIVGTTKAFRGFESAINLPHVFIADEPAEFRLCIRRALGLPRNSTLTPDELLQSFYWKSQLSDFVSAIEAF